METTEEKKMDSSSLNATEIAVGSLLPGRGGVGGVGGGAWNSGGIIGAPFAGLSTIQHSIDDAKDCIRGGNSQLRSEFNNNHLIDILFQQDSRAGQTHLEMTREMAAIRAEAKECCCDLKGEIKDLEVSRLKDELAQSRDANNITATVQGTAAALAPVIAQAVAQAVAACQPA